MRPERTMLTRQLNRMVALAPFTILWSTNVWTQRHKLLNLCDFISLKTCSTVLRLMIVFLSKTVHQGWKSGPTQPCPAVLASCPHYVHKSAVPSSAFFCWCIHFLHSAVWSRLSLACLTSSLKPRTWVLLTSFLILSPMSVWKKTSLKQRVSFTFAFTLT